ncbi:MAG: hypothetical protein C0504_17755 [Candidatus Solibacter sp.]|nr:hypothetical protein [Candidatus Solibacter sp.]
MERKTAIQRGAALLAGLSMAAAATLFAAGAVLGDNAMHVRRVPASHPNECQCGQVDVKARDGVRLSGRFLPVERAGRARCAIALHGVGDHGGNALWLARMLAAAGYSALLADSRAHGQSGGELATYGVLERNDVSSWVDFLSSAPECIDGIYAYGASMGAGILLQSLAGERRLKAVVAECPFPSFAEVARHRIRGFFHETPWMGATAARPIVFGGILYARVRYGIDLGAAAPEKSVAGVKTPILIIHGDADDNIPLGQSQAIAARNPEIQLWVVPGARHTGAASAAPEEFKRRLLGWFDAH